MTWLTSSDSRPLDDMGWIALIGPSQGRTAADQHKDVNIQNARRDMPACSSSR
jgi:hypothetical protein